MLKIEMIKVSNQFYYLKTPDPSQFFNECTIILGPSKSTELKYKFYILYLYDQRQVLDLKKNMADSESDILVKYTTITGGNKSLLGELYTYLCVIMNDVTHH